MTTIPLPLARYRLDFMVETPLTLPAYAGSALRGVFGLALRSAACVTGRDVCDGCPLVTTCPYAVVFEPRPPVGVHSIQDFSQIPRPYVIEPPDWGEKDYMPGEPLSFHLVLAGRALSHLSLVLFAFGKALESGISKRDSRARLLQVTHGDTVVLRGKEGSIAPHDTSVPPPGPMNTGAIALRFDAPLRLQSNGRPAKDGEMTARRLLNALVRRVALVSEFHGQGALSVDFKALSALADTLESERDLKWRDWTRWSNRQDRGMSLGGLVGRWTLRGELAPFMPFLHLGQWLHVGKETAFGLGAYRLEAA